MTESILNPDTAKGWTSLVLLTLYGKLINVSAGFRCLVVLEWL
jgi:hypothetical protein